jgi:uncharacterized membrane protein YdjX (TVP38/TMEM64 family)
MTTTSDPASSGGAPSPLDATTMRRASTLRRVLFGMVAVAIVGLGLWAWKNGNLTADSIGAWIRSWGCWSTPAFVIAFSLGQLLNVPGLAFVLAAKLAYGPWLGFLLAYGGAVVAVTVPFLLTRAFRAERKRAWQPRWRVLRNLLDGAEKHPIRSVFFLRLLLWLSPPLGYALAFTGIRARHYVIGSALGLLPFIGLAIYGMSFLK